jgi:formylglycine-generating enzyme required for sulfatase activity
VKRKVLCVVRHVSAAAALLIALLGCEVLGYTPVRDNPNDPYATVVAAPAFDPPGDTYSAAQTVTITCPTPGATIRYTTDDTTPTSRVGMLYVAPVAIGGSMTLRAIAYAGNMTDSVVVSATYTIAIAPASPQGLSVGSATTTSLSISWSASEGATSYQLFRDSSAAGGFTTRVYDDVGLTFTDTGLSAGTTYYYKVQATNGYGTSAMSEAVSGTATLAGSAPGTPAGLAVSDATPTSLTLSWATVAEATGYQLYRDVSLTGAFSTLVHDGAAALYSDTGLNADTAYYYKVRATNTNGSSALSASATGRTTAASGAPAVPTGLVIGSPTSTRLTVSWTASAGATSYQVYRDTSSGGAFSRLVYDGTELSSTDTGLVGGTTYYYKVRATNGSGSSPLSGAQSGVTNAGVLALVAVPGGTFQLDSTASDLMTVSGFSMSRYPVTRTQFTTVMGQDPTYTPQSSGMNDPVQGLRWFGAIAFCNRLSLAEGLTPVYSVSVGGVPVDFATLTYSQIPTQGIDPAWGDWVNATAAWGNDGYRLPTEMEHMWAMMGGPADSCPGDIVGGQNTGGYKKGYSGSSEANGGQTNLGLYAWYTDNSGHTTNPVGSKLPNELGLYDLSGNVSEWCWDAWGDSLPTGSQTDYQGPARLSGWVVRVCDFNGSAAGCKVASRGGYGDASGGIGFRVVRRAP